MRAPTANGAVHPRVCGELSARIRASQSADGSSPRVRGTRRTRGPRRSRPRFIPACAGNSSASALASWISTVHPRVCGELIVHPANWPTMAGSSPRVRGTPGGGPRLRALHRFIPACAGNSMASRRRSRAASGSSPRVRGTRWDISTPPVKRRFIPACAGNSYFATLLLRQTPVHPRVCGELFSPSAELKIVFGSSPRVRGTPGRLMAAGIGRRFIPACAGNSTPARSPTPSPTVHPRVCGELFLWRSYLMVAAGSSPRVRGTRQHHVIPTGVGPGSSPRVRGTLLLTGPPKRGDRFIPACAGNSRPRPARRRRRTVHPRVCGELIQAPQQPAEHAGSSPRVRGTRSDRPRAARDRRFIPACAGNSSV